jgi:hypothetical protein
MTHGLCAIIALMTIAVDGAAKETRMDQVLYTYTLPESRTSEAYDEAVAVACLQGLINRAAPRLYVLSPADEHPEYWLRVLSEEGRWLSDRQPEPVADLSGLVALAEGRLKGAVIWDPDVPATLNVATTIAAVDDGVVLSPKMANRYLGDWPSWTISAGASPAPRRAAPRTTPIAGPSASTSPRGSARLTSSASTRTPSPPAPAVTRAM